MPTRHGAALSRCTILGSEVCITVFTEDLCDLISFGRAWHWRIILLSVKHHLEGKPKAFCLTLHCCEICMFRWVGSNRNMNSQRIAEGAVISLLFVISLYCNPDLDCLGWTWNCVSSSWFQVSSYRRMINEGNPTEHYLGRMPACGPLASQNHPRILYAKHNLLRKW